MAESVAALAQYWVRDLLLYLRRSPRLERKRWRAALQRKMDQAGIRALRIFIEASMPAPSPPPDTPR